MAELLDAGGACAFGVTPLHEVEPEVWRLYLDWIAAGKHAGMKYMENHLHIRRDPRLLLEGARSLISVAFNYRQRNPYLEIATYALGEDYHKVIRKHLKPVVSALKERLGGKYRICVDSAPILERYWAEKAGVGRISHTHGNLVAEGVGSMVFLAEIICDVDLPSFSWHKFAGESAETEEKKEDKSVCPGGALINGEPMDAGKCINYLTIEHRGEWNEEERGILSAPGARGRIFGCDICQLACGSNKGEPAPILEEFLPSPMLSDLIRYIKRGDLEGLKSLPLGRSPLGRTGAEKLIEIWKAGARPAN